MGNVSYFMIVKAFGFVLLFVSVILFFNFTVDQDGLKENLYKIDASEAAIIVSNDSIAQSYFFVNFAVDRDGSEENIYKINTSEAVTILSNDSIARDYMSEYFLKPKWRAVNVSMLVNSTLDFNGSEYLWDVKIMERTCACSSIKDLYVVEGQVSPITGEIINITTGLVLESNYDKQMCASTVCH